MSVMPTAGAMRAARVIMTADDPARFTADFAAEQEQRDMAEIIDRETGCRALVKALKKAQAWISSDMQGIDERSPDLRIFQARMRVLARASAIAKGKS